MNSLNCACLGILSILFFRYTVRRHMPGFFRIVNVFIFVPIYRHKKQNIWLYFISIAMCSNLVQ